MVDVEALVPGEPMGPLALDADGEEPMLVVGGASLATVLTSAVPVGEDGPTMSIGSMARLPRTVFAATLTS